MPDWLGVALATPGLVYLCLTLVVAGIVRGFTGFGTGLVFMPVAMRFLPAAEAVLAVAMLGLAVMPVLVPRALRRGDTGDVALMGGAALVTMPLGIALLAAVDPVALRWFVALAASLTLAALLTGWRYRGTLKKPGLAAIGASAGVLGGTTGLTGPPVILFYLAGTKGAEVVRANTILFLFILDLGLVANLLLGDVVHPETLGLAVLLLVPYAGAIALGQRLFQPGAETAYRRAAYAVIALAILSGLPLLD